MRSSISVRRMCFAAWVAVWLLGGCAASDRRRRMHEDRGDDASAAERIDASASDASGESRDGALVVLTDAQRLDGSNPETQVDAGDDGGRDGGTDPDRDAGADTGDDAGNDAGRDAGNDAGRDAGNDAGRDAGCMPSGVERCNHLDDDCNGLVDDIDAAHDGVFDCHSILILGGPGSHPETQWLAFLRAQGTVTRLDDTVPTTLTPSLLASYDVVVFDQLRRAYPVSESNALRDWVASGGGVITINGFGASDEDRTRANSLLASSGLQHLEPTLTGLATFAPHPSTAGLSSLDFLGGYAISATAEEGVVNTITARVMVSGATTPMPCSVAQERGRGRIVVWGDEWIAFDSFWMTVASTRVWWAGALGWVTHAR